ncbi:MAG: hypothetical protein RL417_450 [Pseudomonadota bacterium]|jgi:hypothetical protein
MNTQRCRFCVGEFLKGHESCAHCGQILESPIGQRRSTRACSADDLFRGQADILNDEAGADKEENDLQNILFDWKNPVVLNIVGSLVCAMLLIATLLEL